MPLWIGRYIGTALLIGGLQEGIAAVSRYQRWEPWRFFLSAVIVGAVIAVAIWFAADVTRFPLWGQIVYVALFLLGPVRGRPWDSRSAARCAAPVSPRAAAAEADAARAPRASRALVRVD